MNRRNAKGLKCKGLSSTGNGTDRRSAKGLAVEEMGQTGEVQSPRA